MADYLNGYDGDYFGDYYEIVAPPAPSTAGGLFVFSFDPNEWVALGIS